MAFTNRARLPIMLRNAQFPSDRNVFRKADGAVVTLFVRVRKTYQLVTDWLPEQIHQKLAIALAHDYVNIEGRTYFGGISLDSAYDIEYQNDVPGFQLGRGTGSVEVTPFDATNDNCRTCDSMNQLVAVDDIYPTPVGDGATLNIDVAANDTICCYPAAFSIVSFNTSWLAAASISSAGVITATANATVGQSPYIKAITYRITCPDGSYDEADVLIEFDGSAETCAPPGALTAIDVAKTTASIMFTGVAPYVYPWRLYECDNLLMPIASGTATSITPVALTGLSAATCYRFVMWHVCFEGGASDSVYVEFTTQAESAQTCARFRITADDGTENRVSYFYSYYDCSGNMINSRLTNGSYVDRCMMTDAGSGIPVYFSGDAPISYIRLGPCGASGELAVRGGNTLGTMCAQALQTVYLSPPYTALGVGAHVFTDVALTVPFPDAYIVDATGGAIYNVTTGIVTSTTGSTC